MRSQVLLALAALGSAALLSCAPVRKAAPPPAPPPPAPAPAPAQAGEEQPPLLQLSDAAKPVRYALQLEVVPGRPSFRGVVEIETELATPRSFVWLHGRGLRVAEATVRPWNGRALPATYAQVNDDGVAKLTFDRELRAGKVVLRLVWEADFRNEDLVGLYAARQGKEAYAATQLEMIEARTVFPCFDDPRFKTPFDVTLTVPADLVAISNAPPASEVPATDGMKRVRFARTERLPTYLVFVGVGPFDVVSPRPLPPTELRPRALPIRGFAPKGHGKELAFALEATAALVPWLEQYLGVAYPYPKLDQIALPAFAHGGMENAGAIAYRDALLLAPEGAPEEGRRTIARVVAHELAHQWFGDLVTPPWWTDAWLNESFATWLGERAVARWKPDWNVELDAARRSESIMGMDSLAASRAVRQPLEAMSRVEDQFDRLSYVKGSAVLGGFEALVGEETFREGIRAYVAAHRHGTGSTAAVYEALSKAAGRDLAPAFASFVERPGVPLVATKVACEKDGARLVLSQSRWLPRGSTAPQGEPWQVPVCAQWEAGGRPRRLCTLLEAREGALPLGAECPAWVVPHAGVGYYRFTLAPKDLAALRAKGLAKLSAAEKISLVRNLRAAQRAGSVPWGQAMEAVAALASDPDPEVAIEPAELLAVAQDRLVPEKARPAAGAYARMLYRPVLERIGWDPRPGESAATKRLRAEIVDLLALGAADPDVLREAARRGAAFAGLDGAPPRADAVDPDLVEVALAAAVRERGAPAFDALLARLGASEDPQLRPRLLAALSRGDDPALAARAAELWRRPEVRPHERRGVFATLGSRSAGNAALLAALEREPDALLGSVPPVSTTWLVGGLAHGCDRRDAERLRKVLEPRLAAFPLLRRPLAQAVEEIGVCAAEREAEGRAAAAFFTAAAPATKTAANLPVDTAAPSR